MTAIDLGRRLPEPKPGEGSRFTSRYGVQRLVPGAFRHRAIEKSLKRWPRQWNIERTNPELFELFRGSKLLCRGTGPPGLLWQRR
jgi:putative endonuclease